MTAPGWTHFDPDVVDALRRRAVAGPDSVGMPCPLRGHDHELPWQDGDRGRGTVPHGEPALRFHASSTYVLVEPLDNIIVGRDLVARILAGGTGKAETGRLGNENSEDALSWNVFRSLQEAGALGRVARGLVGADVPDDVELFLWGSRVTATGIEPAPAIKSALNALEPSRGRRTEPDIVLRIAGWGWLVIEAKLNSATPRLKEDRLEQWIERYARPSGGVLDEAALAAADPARIPGQLLRNVALANRLRDTSERSHVVALVPSTSRTDLGSLVRPFVAATGPVTFSTATWEMIHDSTGEDPATGPLRDYLRDKSVHLARAFNLPEQDRATTARSDG